MSGRGKRKDEDDHASDGDSEGHPPPKKASKRDSSDDSSDDITVCEISKNRRVSVRNWNGKVGVDIREFYVKDGKQMPGKKEPYFGEGNKSYLEGQGREEGGLGTMLQKEWKADGNGFQNRGFTRALKILTGNILSCHQWNVLRNHVEEIDKAVNEA
ncbi:unnamed protein product [Malus baccata var. baccata]